MIKGLVFFIKLGIMAVRQEMLFRLIRIERRRNYEDQIQNRKISGCHGLCGSPVYMGRHSLLCGRSVRAGI